MKYQREVYEDGVRILSDGEEIARIEGGWSEDDGEILDAILDDANFGNPQRDALKAVFGLIETTRLEETLPDES